jgi:putative nucleotidyltransferase with HDIG domain
MDSTVLSLWPELEWIKDPELKEKTARTWELALHKSVLKPEDLNRIPFTLLCGPDLKVTFMDHKRSVVHIAKAAAEKMNDFYHGEMPIDMDVLISGAILADVGKMLEYELDANGKAVQGKYGQYLRHPFSGVSLAEQCGLPASVCHIIAAHAGEGDHVKRSVEAYIVHHSDFMTFLPFKDRLK